MNTHPTIVLADDHVLVAQGIQKLLEPEFELLRIVPDGRALLKAVEECSPDVVIVDISLPLLNGLDASRQILKHNPAIKVIVLTMHSEPSFVTEALRIGVSICVEAVVGRSWRKPQRSPEPTRSFLPSSTTGGTSAL